jgi:hypothetical protein
MLGLLKAVAADAAERASREAARAARKAGLFLGALLAFLTAFGFLTAALYTFIEIRHGTQAAELSLAGCFALLGLALLFAGVLAGRRPRRPPPPSPLMAPPPADGPAMPAGAAVPMTAIAFALGFVQGIARRKR